MSLTLRHVRAFVEVAHHGSFRRAAEKLFLSQPALTITINQLEDMVGVSLFNRTTRRVILTTDAPGCRETVIDGENGYLVPVQDEVALARRMLQLIDDSGSLDRMGQRSRELAEARFDVREVNRVILQALGLEGAGTDAG